MKSGYLLAPLALAMAMAASGPNANAQPYPPQPYPPRAAQEAVTYGYATVLRVNPAFETYHAMEQQCDDGGYQRAQNDTTGGTIVGAIIGGALGNTVGKGDGRKAATVAGAVAGGVVGHNIAKNSDPGYYQGGCRMVDVERDDRRPAGFDVEYNYKGDVYVARMSYDPGNRIRVRVSVVPADDAPRR